MRQRCVGVKHDGDRIETVTIRTNGHVTEYDVDGVLSTLALQDLIRASTPRLLRPCARPQRSCATATSASSP